MTNPNPEVSHLFRELADVLDAFETTETDVAVTHATPVSDNLLERETVSVNVGVQIPFFDRETGLNETDIELTATDVHIRRDGSLYVELRATVGDAEEETAKTSDATEDAKRDTESNGDADSSRSAKSESDDTHPKPKATTAVVSRDESRTDCPDPDSANEQTDHHDEQASTDSESQSVATDQEEKTEQPAYRDPDRLREVYNEYDTFSEMTDALDVSVTPQTVRRYMIEHNIHEPASTTGSRSIEVLLNTDPDSISIGGNENSGEERASRTDSFEESESESFG